MVLDIRYINIYFLSILIIVTFYSNSNVRIIIFYWNACIYYEILMLRYVIETTLLLLIAAARGAARSASPALPSAHVLVFRLLKSPFAYWDFRLYYPSLLVRYLSSSLLKSMLRSVDFNIETYGMYNGTVSTFKETCA